jgi:uncharacterized protein (TIGR02996 family)
MNPDLANLLGALREQPGDELAYLALADWCLEQPNPATQARGEHVRLSLELGKILQNARRAKRHPLASQVKALERRHRTEWLGSMRDLAHRCDFLPGGLLKVAFSGGRIDQVRPRNFPPPSELEFAWVSTLEIRAVHRDQLRLLAGWLPAGCVRAFVLEASLPSTVRTNESAGTLVQVIPRCRWVSGIRSFTLYHGWPQSSLEAADLAGLADLQSLQELRLLGVELSTEGCRALARSPHLTRLRELHLDRCGLGEQHLRALLIGAFAPPLHTLSLANNRLTPAAVEILAGWPGLKGLRTLKLDGNPLGDGEPAILSRLQQLVERRGPT